jgi:hypothetical protein
MPDKFEPFARQPCLVKPDNNFTLWCPFCDDWRLSDSMVARKKLGLHISSYHPEETRFERGKPPPTLQDVEERNFNANIEEEVVESNSL